MDITNLILAALAGVAGGLVPWAGNLVIEWFKARHAEHLESVKVKEALRGEFAKLKAQKFGELWTAFDDIETKAAKLWFASISIRNEVNTDLLVQDEGEAASLEKARLSVKNREPLPEHPRLDEIAKTRLDAELLPKINELFPLIDRLDQSVDLARFWLGVKITTRLGFRCSALRRYLEHLRTYRPSAIQAAPSGERDDLDSLLRSV